MRETINTILKFIVMSIANVKQIIPTFPAFVRYSFSLFIHNNIMILRYLILILLIFNDLLIFLFVKHFLTICTYF